MGSRRMVLAAALCLSPTAGLAVFSGDMSPRAPSGDADYAEAVRLREARDWAGSIAALNRVIERRPWHDNAHALLGNSYRRIGEWELALEHYHRAIALNPRHRQALEYLGQAYLQMHWPEKAAETLEKLAQVCAQVRLTFSDGDFSDGCVEYRLLRASIARYAETGEPPVDP